MGTFLKGNTGLLYSPKINTISMWQILPTDSMANNADPDQIVS